MIPLENSDEATEPLRVIKDKLFTFIKHLSNQKFIIAYYNLYEEEQEIQCIFADVGLPYASGYGFDMTDVFTGEHIGIKRDYHIVSVPGHDCRLFCCRLAKCAASD